MGRINVRIDGTSCDWPPQVNRRFINQALQNGWRGSVGRLTAFSLLKYQDPSLGELGNFSSLKTLHPGSLIPRYLYKDSNGWLTCRSTDSEQLGELSELAAIGASLAFYKDATGCCANEIVRVTTSGTRLDFRLMFPAIQTNLRVEAKGIFHPNSLSRARRNFDKKVRAVGPGVGGFLFISRTEGTESYLELRDPPGERLEFIKSLEARLRFYYGVLRSMYGSAHPEFEEFTRQYRLALLSYLEHGDWPSLPRTGFQILMEQTLGDRRYKGRLFDRRLLPDAVRDFNTWSLACEAFPNPYFFTGLDERSFTFFAERLESLLDYSDLERDLETEQFTAYVAESGVAHVEYREPPDPEHEERSSHTFTLLRRQEERRKTVRNQQSIAVQEDVADEWEEESIQLQLQYVFET